MVNNLLKKIYQNLNKMNQESKIENQRFVKEFNKTQNENTKFVQKIKNKINYL